MSLYGISVKNALGHSIISSDIETLHFGGVANYISTIAAQDSKIQGFNPAPISETEKTLIANTAANLAKPAADAKRIADATAAGAKAIANSQALDGTTTAGNVTTIRSTNPNTGIVTTTTTTTSGSTSTTTVSVSPTSVKDDAYNASLAASGTTYDTYIASTKAEYIGQVDQYNAGITTSAQWNNIGKSFIHSFTTSGVAAHAPLFFIKPTHSSDSYGVLRQFFANNVWNIEIIQSGDASRRPDVLTFKRPSEVPISSEAYGLITYLADGVTVAFDSRRRPLAILGAIAASSPTVPCAGGIPDSTVGLQSNGVYYPWNENKLDFDFSCSNVKNTYPISSSHTILPQNLMFCAPALTQAVYSRLKYGYKLSKGGWFSSDQAHWSTAKWWAMYHQTYSISGSSLSAGWCVYKSGYFASANWESGGWLGGGGGTSQSGSAPYPDKTINQLTNLVLIADASFYI